MATPSQVTMLREISAAGDRARTGALDVEWEGAHATLFFMFGHPSHVAFETADGRKLAGEAALEAFVDELPTEFRVAPWRRAMVTDDTLHCSAEDLMGLFQRRKAVESNGHAVEPPAPAIAPSTDALVPSGTSPAVPATPPAATNQPPFALSDFPLLPLGTALWTDAAVNIVNLEAAVPRLPDSLLVLAGPTCQGAALIAGGRITDAVWVNGTGGRLGDEAAHALMNSLEGTLTAYRVDDLRWVTALPMLWRSPRLGPGLPAAWLHTDDIVAEVRNSGRSCSLVVDSADPGVALFASGELVAVYTVSHRWPDTSMAALRSLLHEPGARVKVIGEVAEAPAPAEVADAPPVAPAIVPSPAVDDTTDATADAPEAVETATPDSMSAVTTDDDSGAPHEVAPEATTVAAADEPSAPLDPQTPEQDAETADAVAVQPKGKGKAKSKGKAKADTGDAEAPLAVTVDAAIADSEDLTRVEPSADGAEASADSVAAAPPEDEAESAEDDTRGGSEPADTEPSAATARLAVDDLQFAPALFTIANLSSDSTDEPTSMTGVEARAATEFVPARLDIDVDALRAELSDIATAWLGADDAAPVAKVIGAARPGVDDFVSTIAAIGAMEIPGHETAVVRAMAREMHFRASEVLCGV